MNIELRHGSGGEETGKLIASLFAKYLGNPILDRMEDGAVLPPLSGVPVMTTDSFVVSPLFFPGGDIGRLSVCGTVNDLASMGARPLYLTAGFILETGLSTDVLEPIVRSMAETAKEAGVTIVAGDTKVIEGKGGLYINTAGLGDRAPDCEISSGNLRWGCDPRHGNAWRSSRRHPHRAHADEDDACERLCAPESSGGSPSGGEAAHPYHSRHHERGTGDRCQ